MQNNDTKEKDEKTILQDFIISERKAREDFEKRIMRKMKDFQSTLDSVDSDREIIEELVTKVGGTEEAVRLFRSFLSKQVSDLKTEVQIRGDMLNKDVGEKVDEIHQIVDNKKVIVVRREGLLQRLLKKIKK